MILFIVCHEENTAIQRAPLDKVIFAEIQQLAHESNNADLDRSLLSNKVTLGQYIGPKVSVYKQTTQSKVNHHIYPSGYLVIKAFTTEDFVFFDKYKCQLKVINDSSFNVADSVRITWCIQKNWQNGQTIILLSDSANPDLCLVRHKLRMVLRARILPSLTACRLGVTAQRKHPWCT
jgi:hypothetical protein